MPADNLVVRLTNQLAARGVKDAKSEAISILKARGHLDDKGNLTEEGRKRQELGADGRAIDRASKASGRKPGDYVYNAKTNMATLKHKMRK